MDTLRLRSSARYLATSRAVVIFVLFLLVLAPLLWLLLSVPWRELALLAALAPAAGLLVAAVMLVLRLWRRSRPALLIDDHVTIPRTGVSFPLERLERLQLYTRDGRVRLVLLPDHVTDSVPSRAVEPYTVPFPDGTNYLPYELVEHIQRRAGTVGVDKLGTI